MKILIALTYYRPHVSGLTIYVERLARALVGHGHEVTVLTSQYDSKLDCKEVVDGVNVVRVPVVMRISKGVIMPTFGIVATKLVRSHDVLSIHLPQFDASGLVLRGRIFGKPSVLTYHCDLKLPGKGLNRLVNGLVDFSNRVAACFADSICAYTSDFAINSPLLSNYLKKVHYILPPVEVDRIDNESVSSWANKQQIRDNYPIIGVASRLAADKGIEYLLDALPQLIASYPKLKVIHAGPIDDVIGERQYYKRLQPKFDKFKDYYTFLGTLDSFDMTSFYRTCDVLVLPSINSTESFGLVQIEAALCGTPTVASNLPGVRVPVRMTGMGCIVRPEDADDLSRGIKYVLDNNKKCHMKYEEIMYQFSPNLVATKYENLFTDLLSRRVRNSNDVG